MDWKDAINEGSIALVLVCSIAALVAIVIISGAGSVAATGIRDLALLLGGALAGTKVPKQ